MDLLVADHCEILRTLDNDRGLIIHKLEPSTAVVFDQDIQCRHSLTERRMTIIKLQEGMSNAHPTDARIRNFAVTERIAVPCRAETFASQYSVDRG